MKKQTIAFVLTLLVLWLNACKKDNNSNDPNQQLIQRLKEVTDSVINHTKVPGIVALVVDKTKGIEWVYTAGVSDIPNGLPMNEDFIFRIGSNTKTMTGTVLLQLVDEGFLNLEDKLSKFFSQYPKADSITVRMLCNMTSGIYNYSDTSAFTAIMTSNPTKVWSPAELVDLAFTHTFYFTPGTAFHYSNTNTILLGMIIEKLTGNTLESEIANRVINPLGVQHTGFLTSGTQLPGNHAKGYYAGTYEPGAEYSEVFDYSWAWAAGSAYSVPRELQKYVERLVGGGYLSDTLQFRRMTEMVPSITVPGVGYGLCMFHRKSFFGHNGGCPGFTSSMYHSNLKDATVIIYFNCQLDAYAPDNLFYRYMDILYGTDFQ